MTSAVAPGRREVAAERQSRTRKRWLPRTPHWPTDGAAIWGLVLTASVLMVALIGPWLASVSPVDLVGSPFDPPSADAWLGTDVVGRDVLARVLCGGGTILALSAVATLLGVAAGGLLGICAGYFGGLLDDGIMRLLDVLLAFPQMILALLFVSVLGSSFSLVAILVAALHAPQVARVIRAAALRVRDQDYVRFARAIGTPHPVVILREIIPNVSGPLLVEASLRFTFSIALIAGLSFLGLAQDPPAANWGMMVNENRIGLLQNPWPVVVPVGLIAVLTVGINFLTDAFSRRIGGGGHLAASSGALDIPAGDDPLPANPNDVGEPL